MFAALIKNVLLKSELREDLIDQLIEENIKLYTRVFTSSTIDPSHNYEDLEQKGDAAANAFLVWYFYKRFPQLDCPAGVPIIARLKIKYASKNSFHSICEKLGFWPFIQASQAKKDSQKKSLLEDVFESFIGATHQIFDKKYGMGFGFIIICRILTNIFDEIHISLQHDKLYDAKTRLKEHFDSNKHLGKLHTAYDPASKKITLSIIKEPTKPVNIPIDQLSTQLSNRIATITVSNNMAVVTYDPTKSFLSAASAPLKADAEQAASQKALQNLGVSYQKNLSLIC